LFLRIEETHQNNSEWREGDGTGRQGLENTLKLFPLYTPIWRGNYNLFEWQRRWIFCLNNLKQ
jgi:hypothetical protein